MARASQQIADAVRRAILLGMAAAFSLVALGFLTAGLWIALADAFDHLVAALGVAGVYFLIAIILFIMARSRSSVVPGTAGTEFPRPPAPPLYDAFLMGMRTGQSLRRR